MSNLKKMFKVEDRVDVVDRADLTHYGKIVKIFGEKALVHFKISREPKKRDLCDSCGWPGFLSVSGNTGEIVCMKSGCGHGHGFEEREESIPLEKLINISSKKRKEKKKGFISDIVYKLNSAQKDGLITEKERNRVLKILKIEKGAEK